MKKLNSHPTVSVVIPTFNRAQFITQAIDSVLAQTYKNFEIIIIDDGSTDDTREVLKPYKNNIRYIYQENQGAASARNKGIQSAKGEYIAFLDSDDLFLPQKLEKQVAVLKKLPDINVVYSNFYFGDENGNIMRRAHKSSMFKSGFLLEELLFSKVMFGYMQTWTVRKKCFQKIGYLDTELRMSEDIDIAVRLAKCFKLHGMSEPLTIQRLHSQGRLSASSSKVREKYSFNFLLKLFQENKNNPVIQKNYKKLKSFYYHLAGKSYLRKVDFDIDEARKRFWLAIKYYPFQFSSYFFLLFTLIGNKRAKSVIKWSRQFPEFRKNFLESVLR